MPTPCFYFVQRGVRKLKVCADCQITGDRLISTLYSVVGPAAGRVFHLNRANRAERSTDVDNEKIQTDHEKRHDHAMELYGQRRDLDPLEFRAYCPKSKTERGMEVS